MQLLSLNGRHNFLSSYSQPAIEQEFIAMKYPQCPNHTKQQYFLAKKGFEAIKK
jgi:hypothetical protein